MIKLRTETGLWYLTIAEARNQHKKLLITGYWLQDIFLPQSYTEIS